MKKILITAIFTTSVGLFSAIAQIDEADPKDNTRYEMEIDSMNEEKVTESVLGDTTSTYTTDTTLDTIPSERSDTMDLKNRNGNDESIRERSIKDQKIKSDKSKQKKLDRMKKE
jgi:hypothetical protein